MTFLIIGLGSIGQRHLRNLRQLYGNDVRICAFRERNNGVLLNSKGMMVDGVLEEKYNVVSYFDLNECFEKEHVDAVIISTITAKHILYAMEAAKRRCALFIEKPLSHNMECVNEFCMLAEEKDSIVQMGFQLRYHPCIKRLKTILDSQEIRNVYSADFLIAEKVSKMHQYEDYRGTYIVNSQLGGGIVLNQQIHEIDLMLYLFGMPSSVFSVVGKLEDVDSDVEDRADSIYLYNDKCIKMHADFSVYPPKREIVVRGENGYVEIDLLKSTLKIQYSDGRICDEVFSDFERNDMFLEEMQNFVLAIQGEQQIQITLLEGIQSLYVALSTLEAAKNNSLKILGGK